MKALATREESVMNAFATKLTERWHGFIQTPSGMWVELYGWSDNREACERRLKTLGFTVLTIDVVPVKQKDGT